MDHKTSYLPIAFKANLEKHPEDFSLDNLDKTIAGVIAKTQVRDAINTVTRTGKGELEKEYTHLRLDLFKRQEEAKSCEVKVNNSAAKIKHHEQRIKMLKELSKKAFDAGNPLQESAFNYQVTLEEGYLADAMDEWQIAKKDYKFAVRALHTFNKQRLEELKVLIAEKAKAPAENKVL